jgi:hypothetical protein
MGYPDGDLPKAPARLDRPLHAVTRQVALHGNKVLRRAAAREPPEGFDVLRQALLDETEPLLRSLLKATRHNRASLGHGLDVLGRPTRQLFSLRPGESENLRELLRGSLEAFNSRVQARLDVLPARFPRFDARSPFQRASLARWP